MATSLIVGRTYRVLANCGNNLRTGEHVIYVGTERGTDVVGGDRVTTDPSWKPGDPIPAIGNLYADPRPTPWVTLVNPDWLQGPVEPQARAATETPAPAPGVKVRIDADHNSHEFPRGTVVTLVRPYSKSPEERFWLATGGDWSPGQPEPEWTPAAYRESRNSTRYIESDHFTVLPVDITTTTEETPVTASPATEFVVGRKYRIISNTYRTNHPSTSQVSEPPVGTEVTYLRQHGAHSDSAVVTVNPWHHGDRIPSTLGSEVASSSAYFYVSKADLADIAAEKPTTGDVAIITVASDVGNPAPIGATVRVLRQYGQYGQRDGGTLYMVSTRLTDTVESTSSDWPHSANSLFWAIDNHMRLSGPRASFTPTAPAVGVKVGVTADSSSHDFPIGTTLTLAEQSGRGWLAVVGDWSVGDTVPRQGVSRDARSAVPGTRRYITARDFTILPVQSTASAPSTSSTTVEAERDAAVKALEDFKRKVREIATSEANARGWCSEIDDVLAKIEPGLTRMKTYTRVTRTLQVVIDVEQDGNSDEVLLEPGALITEASIRSGHRQRANIVSAAWSSTPQRATITEAERDARPASTPLTRGTVPPNGTRVRVLANPRLSTGVSSEFAEGDILVTATNALDSDGDLYVRTENYSKTGHLLPEYLTLA